MPLVYTFIWLSDNGGVAAVDSARCLSDSDAIQTARTLLRNDGFRRRCRRIETYSGERFVDGVQRAAA